MYRLMLVFGLLISFQNLKGQMGQFIDSIQVTATQIPTLIKETGKSITILDSKQINELPVSSVDELLRYVGGVNLNVRSGFGVQSDIGMRGSTFSQVLVLLDNVRVNGPLTGHFNNNVPIAMAEIGRIEVIRGPASASFGADAVGGVIHVKSKTYLANVDSPDQAQLSGTVSTGSHQLQRLDIGMYVKNDKWTLSASAKSNIAAGEERDNPNFAAGTDPDSLWRNDFDVRTYSAALAYAFTDNIRWYSRVGYDRRDFSAKYFYTRSTFDESRETVASKWYQTALSHKTDKMSNDLTLGLTDTEDKFVFNPLFGFNLHNTRQFSANYTHNYKISQKTSLAAGAQWINRTVESNDRGDHDNNNIGAFVTLSHFLTENIKATGSVRVENDDNFGTEILPQLNVAYFKGNLTLRSSVGKSIRAGDFTERFVSNQLADLSPGRNVGNPDLQAERAWTIDFGADYNLNSNTFISSSIFYRTSTDLIDFTLTNSNDITNLTNLQSGENYFYATNVATASTAGLELGIENTAMLSQDASLTSRLNATLLSTTTGDEETVSKYLANHPNLNVSTSLQLDYKNIGINWSSFFINRDEETVENILGEVQSNYWINNIRLSYTPLNKGISIFGEIQNIGNTDYQEILGAPLAKRWFMCGFSFDLK